MLSTRATAKEPSGLEPCWHPPLQDKRLPCIGGLRGAESQSGGLELSVVLIALLSPWRGTATAWQMIVFYSTDSSLIFLKKNCLDTVVWHRDLNYFSAEGLHMFIYPRKCFYEPFLCVRD